MGRETKSLLGLTAKLIDITQTLLEAELALDKEVDDMVDIVSYLEELNKKNKELKKEISQRYYKD